MDGRSHALFAPGSLEPRLRRILAATMLGSRCPPSSRPWAIASVLGLWLVALTLRLAGLRLGLPYLHHWDECWVVWSARHMLETNSDVPTSYQYGASLSRLLVWAADGANWLSGTALVRPNDEVALRWVGRFITATISSTGTLAMYFAGRRIPREVTEAHRTGLVAASAYAFAYELVSHARYSVPDANVVTMGAWALAAAAEYLHSRRLRWAFASLIFAGTGFGFKFPGLPLLAIPMLALLFGPTTEGGAERRRRRLLLVLAVPIAAGCFILHNPHFIDRWPLAIRDLSGRIAQTTDGGFSWAYRRTPGVDHLGTALSGLFLHAFGYSVPVAATVGTLCVVGLVSAIRRRQPLMLIAAIHALLVVGGFSLLTRAFLLRNVLVVVPCLCLGFALGTSALANATERLVSSHAAARVPKILIPWVPLLLLSATTAHAAFMNHRLSVDPRIRAMDFIAARTGGRARTAMLTPSVIGLPGHEGAVIRAALLRPHLVLLGASPDCSTVARRSPDYVVSTAYRGPDVPTSPYVEKWYFRNCPGYDLVAHFPANPYEASTWAYPTWLGRASSTLVFARNPAARDR